MEHRDYLVTWIFGRENPKPILLSPKVTTLLIVSQEAIEQHS